MNRDHIRVTGAREHNLANVDVSLPKHRLTVFTGVSGSGKSSLVFDTIAAEARRRLGETFSSFERNRLPRAGRPDVDAIENLSTAIVVDQRRPGGGVRSTVGTATDVSALMRLLWSRAGRPSAGEATAYSFNDPRGMCPACSGRGTVRAVEIGALFDRTRSLNEGAIRFPTFGVGGWMWRRYSETGLFDLDKPLGAFSGEEWDRLLYGTAATAEVDGVTVPLDFEGVVRRLERIWLPKDPETLKAGTREAFDRVIVRRTCPDCAGARLSAAALASRVAGRNIAEAMAMEIEELAEFVRALEPGEAAPVADALSEQLGRLVDIGLGYLTLDRPAGTLSGGEAQRVKLVRHLGGSLTDMIYVFDEPSAGLHPYDVGRLTTLLHALRDQGNTVLVVEHDPAVIAAADHVVDLGPGPGVLGGRITYAGSVAGLAASDTVTGRHLRERVRPRPDPRTPSGWLEIRGATRHNLRGLDVDVPLGVLTAVTGVAGSGKSTLVRELPGTTFVDPGDMHATRRSSALTATGLLDVIRTRFAAANGVSPALFSPNSAGACPHCRGLGVVHTDLGFLDPLVSVCAVCEGRRFTPEVLRYRLHGLDIGEVFGLSAKDALRHFTEPRITDPLRRLVDVGLGYLPLGQPLTSLSGGERQRLRLADELGRDPTGVYVLDEPATGLHMADVAGLVDVLDRLVDGGATVVVVEHDLDVIARADRIIDLGPGPGRHGGHVLFTGTPTDLATAPGSRTGEHLRGHIEACSDPHMARMRHFCPA